MRSDARLELRDAPLADAPAIGMTTVAAWRGAYAGLMNAAYLASLCEKQQGELWGVGFERDPRVIVTALDDDTAVGFARWGESQDADAAPGVGELREIFLHPSAWRRGAGSLLMDEALPRLRAAASREATLWVVHGNARARAFYEARGYEERHDRFRSGAAVHVVRYRREIA